MQSEIGSNFWLMPEEMIGSADISSPDMFNCTGSDYVWLSTCRSAIEFVLRTIEHRNPKTRKVACLPAFTCHTVFEPFIKVGYELVMLPLNKDLTSNAQEVLCTIQRANAGVVLFHRYFGFDTLPEIDAILRTLREMGVIVIEDCTQSMYSDFGRLEADYFVGSIRKWCGVPDGGFAVCRDGVFVNKPMMPDSNLERAKREACEMKYRYLYLHRGNKDEYLTRYREAEEMLDNQERWYSIGKLSRIVQGNLDVFRLKMKRRENYQELLQVLKDIYGIIPVFGQLKNGVVPLYFPVLCENREKTRRLLIKNDVYAPVVWPKDERCPRVCDEAGYMYEHLLCIPLDQRYDVDDMERVGYVLKDA